MKKSRRQRPGRPQFRNCFRRRSFPDVLRSTTPQPKGDEVIAANLWPGGTGSPGDPKDLKATTQLIQNARGDVTIIRAITQGEESFVDLNGNKTYDLGEPFIDLPEPFIDKNDNGIQDSMHYDASGHRLAGLDNDTDYYACYEDFVDLNGNGKWDQVQRRVGQTIRRSGRATHRARWTRRPCRTSPCLPLPVRAMPAPWTAATNTYVGKIQVEARCTAQAAFRSPAAPGDIAPLDDIGPPAKSLDAYSFSSDGFPTTNFAIFAGDLNYNCPNVAPNKYLPSMLPPQVLAAPVVNGSLGGLSAIVTAEELQHRMRFHHRRHTPDRPRPTPTKLPASGSARSHRPAFRVSTTSFSNGA